MWPQIDSVCVLFPPMPPVSHIPVCLSVCLSVCVCACILAVRQCTHDLYDCCSAVYQNSDIYLIDDIFSGMDAKSAMHIFKR